MRKKRIRADNINPVGSEWILYYTDTARISMFCFVIIDFMFCKRRSLALSLHQIIKSCNNHEPRCTIVTVLPHKAHDLYFLPRK